jgi:hypothetical protein
MTLMGHLSELRMWSEGHIRGLANLLTEWESLVSDLRGFNKRLVTTLKPVNKSVLQEKGNPPPLPHPSPKILDPVIHHKSPHLSLLFYVILFLTFLLHLFTPFLTPLTFLRERFKTDFYRSPIIKTKRHRNIPICPPRHRSPRPSLPRNHRKPRPM